MNTVGGFEAKNRLTVLVSGFNRAKARAAADGLRTASRGLSLDGLSIRDLINEGRWRDPAVGKPALNAVP